MAVAIHKVASRPADDHSANWFRQRHQDYGTPIFDQLASERSSVMAFLAEGPIQVELFWPKGQEENSEGMAVMPLGEAAGIDMEGNLSG